MLFYHCTSRTDLLHVFEHLIASPLIQLPVIVILLGAPYTKRAVHATRSTKEASSADLDLAVVYLGHGLGNDVPVCFLIEILAPSMVIYLA